MRAASAPTISATATPTWPNRRRSPGDRARRKRARAIDRRLRTLLSAAALVAANLVPVAGVLFWDWPLATLLALYWAETAVIGVFNVFKMLLIHPLGGLFLGAFFCVHFGMFMFVHALFLAAFFLQGFAGFESAPALLLAALRWELLFLVLSHAVSFVLHWILGDERRKHTLAQQMGAPYSRVILMHVTILFGGFAVLALGAPGAVLALFIVLKTIMDLRAHLKEHGGLRRSPAGAPARTTVP
jgi:hypothetical protein